VARCLLKKIIPQYGISVSIGSDNGLAFMADVVQLLAKRLKIKPTHGLPPPEFRKNKMYKEDSKITIGKTMTGDLPTMRSITTLLRIKSSPI
jgi:hypothetical protein